MRPGAKVRAGTVSCLVLALALCGAGCRAEEVNRPRTVVLDVAYSRFSLSSVTVRQGETVRFVIRNHDPIAHELIVGDQETQDRHEAGSEAHHGQRPGEVSVPAMARAETTLRFESSGPYLFGCHLPGHWAYGMRGTISVV